MPLYRRHRGSLEASLETTVIVKNENELRDEILKDWEIWSDQPSFKKDFLIKIEPYYGQMDKRTGWYTHIISTNINSENSEKFCACGYLSEPFN